VVTRIATMPLDEVVRLVNEWGTLPRELDGRAATTAEPTLTALADELHPIFAGDDRAARVSALLTAAGVRPTLTAAGDGTLLQSWLVDDAAQATRAAAALALREQLSDHPGRIGICADRQCADVYIDHSPAGRRRFCCLTCQNRARAEAFRKRRGSKSPQGLSRPTRNGP
jgi:predicted RNA-binding Zn ribbon-like protein